MIFSKKRIIDPYIKKSNLITEQLHILDANWQWYSQVYRVIKSLIKNLKNKETSQICLNDDTEYATATIMNVAYVKKLVIHLGINYDFEDISDVDAVVYTTEKSTDPDDRFISDVLPLGIRNRDNSLDKATIKIEVSEAVLMTEEGYTTDVIAVIMGAIKHEIMHLYHDITGTDLNRKAGDAYYYASALCRVFNRDIPNKDDIEQELLPNMLFGLYKYLLYGACMYYCDKSEGAAFLQAYNEESKMILRQVKRRAAREQLKDLRKTPIYTLYQNLYEFLMNNMEFCQKIIKNNNTIKDTDVPETHRYITELKPYYKSLSGVSSYILPKKWLRQIKNWLTAADAVHAANITNMNC